MSQTVGDTPSTSGPSGLGSAHPHSLDRSTPKTARPSPVADRTVPTRSSFGRLSGGASLTRRASTRIPSTTSTSPTNTHRHEK